MLILISIHALLAESDTYQLNEKQANQSFLSTLSLRRATGLYLVTEKDIPISIHALLAESDANWFDLWGWAEYFYPRSPCGERLNEVAYQRQINQFLSTLSLRRATAAGVLPVILII